MSITAKELAERLGLSQAAVSLALNNRPGVSSATRKQVLETARELGYDFSRKALSDHQHKGTLCLIIYRKSGAVVDNTPFFSALTDGVSIGCKRGGYDLVLRYLYEDEDVAYQLQVIRTAGFSGLLVLATEMDEASLSAFSHLALPEALPMVVLDAHFEKLHLDSVSIDNVQGAYLAALYLINRYHVQPGYLRSAYAIANFTERADGFYKAIRAKGLSPSQSLVHSLTPSEEGAYSDMRQLLLSGETPARCYFADNDLIAVGAMRAFKEAGYRIPEDVAVIGFDDLPVAQYFDPPLSTVEVPKNYLGETAAGRLIQVIEEKNTLPLKIQVQVKLKKRKSV